jgi:hypothetical protein
VDLIEHARKLHRVLADIGSDVEGRSLFGLRTQVQEVIDELILVLAVEIQLSFEKWFQVSFNPGWFVLDSKSTGNIGWEHSVGESSLSLDVLEESQLANCVRLPTLWSNRLSGGHVFATFISDPQRIDSTTGPTETYRTL